MSELISVIAVLIFLSTCAAALVGFFMNKIGYFDEIKPKEDELTRLQSENAELKNRIVQAIDAVSSNKCSSHEDWAHGVNDATDQHADNLKKMFSDIYGEQ